jgi:hypothetical protein
MPFGIWFSIFLLRGQSFFNRSIFNLLSLIFLSIERNHPQSLNEGGEQLIPLFLSLTMPCIWGSKHTSGSLASSRQATLEPLPGGQVGKLCGLCYVGRRAMFVGGKTSSTASGPPKATPAAASLPCEGWKSDAKGTREKEISTIDM